MENVPYCKHFTQIMFEDLKTRIKVQNACQMKHTVQESDPQSLWYCVECGLMACSRYSKNQCFQRHMKEKNHFLCYNFDQKILWCEQCDMSFNEILTYNQQQSDTKDYYQFEENFKLLLEQFERIRYGNTHRNKSYNQVQNDQQMRNLNEKIFGLSNLGNTCFFNSVMQPILASYQFLNFIRHQNELQEYDTLGKRIIDLYDGVNKKSANPVSVFKKLIQRNKMYGYYNQQDSNECFINLIDIFEIECKKLKVSLNHPFQGYYVYKTKCLVCGMTEYFFEKNSMLLLDLIKDDELKSQKNNIKDEYRKIRQQSPFIMIKNEEIAEHQNVIDSGFDLKNEKVFMNLNDEQDIQSQLEQLFLEYFDYNVYSHKIHGLSCEKCKEKSQYGYKKYYIYKAPKLLVITLKRFKKTSFFSFKKSSKKIKIDEKLDLTKYTLQDQQNSKNTIYDLYATTHHSGSLGGGHYISYVKKNNQWYYISDSYYNQTTLEDVLNSDSYILYYKLRE